MSFKPYLVEGSENFHCQRTIPRKSSSTYDIKFGHCEIVEKSEMPKFDRPTFDCEKAERVVDNLICGSDRLAELDIELVSAYNRKRSISSKSAKKSIKSAQISFIKNRYSRCSDVVCIEKLTRDRITEIEMFELRNN